MVKCVTEVTQRLDVDVEMKDISNVKVHVKTRCGNRKFLFNFEL